MREELLASSRLASQLLSRDHLSALSQAPDTPGAEDLRQLQLQLDAIRQAMPGCCQVTLLGRWGAGEPVVLARSDARTPDARRPDESGAGRPDGNTGTAGQAARDQALRSGQASVAGPVDDGVHNCLDVYVPLAIGGSTALVLGLQVEAGDWRMNQLGRAAQPAGVLALILLFWVLASSGRSASPARLITWRLLPPVTLVMLLLLLGFGSLLRHREQASMREAMQLQVRDLTTAFQKTIVMQGAHLKAVLGGIVDAEARELPHLLAAREAETLLSMHRELYENLHRDFGVTRLSFIAPDGTTLLRVHDPARRGDITTRDTWRESSAARRPVAGLELGSVGGFSLLAVHPVLLRGVCVGFVEIGKEIDDVVQGLRADQGLELALLVRKSRLDRGGWEAEMRRLGRAAAWDALPGEVVGYSTMGPLAPEIETILTRAGEADITLRETSALGREWLLSSSALVDVAGRGEARLLIMQDTSAKKAEFRRLTLLTGVGLGSLLVFLFVFIFVLLRRTDQGIQQREAALRESEDKARKLSRAVEQSPVSVIITDLTGAIEYVNPKFTETTGYTAEEARNQNPRILKSGEMPPEGYNVMWTAISSGREWRGEFKNRRKDGGEYWEFASLSPIRDADGNITHYLAVKEDITERKLVEESLRASEARFRRLFHASSVPMAYVGLDGSVQDLNERFTKVLGYTLEDIPTMERWSVLVHPDEEYRAHARKHWRSAVDEAVATGTDIMPTEYDVVAKDGQLYIFLVSGLVLDGGLLVTLFDVTARKKAEKEARELAERLHKIASRVPGVVFQYLLRPDGSTCFPYASEGIREIYRTTPEDVHESAAKVAEVIHPDDVKRVDASILRSARTLKPWQIEYRVKFPDGAERWLSGNSVPQRESDGSTLWHGVISDITERRQAQEALRESEQTLRDLYEQAPVGIFRSTPQGRYLSVNPYYASVYGYASPEEMINDVTSITSQIYKNPEDRDRLMRELEKHGEVLNFEVERKTRTGQLRWVSVSIRAVRGPGGQVEHMDGFCSDITEQKLVQQALAESESRFRALFENSPVAYQSLDEEGHCTDANDELCALLGYSREELLGRPFSEFWTSVEREGYDERFREFLHVGLASSELRLQRKDGRVIVVLLEGRVQRDHLGRFLRIHCVLYNITERTEMEAALREATERHQRIADTVPLALYDYVQTENGESWYQYLSPRFSEIFEVDPASVVGSRQGIIPYVHPDDRERIEAVDQLASSTGSIFNAETRIITPKGRVKWVHLMSRPRPRQADNGRGTVWSGFMLDITSRKQMEERVREASNQLEITTARAEALAAEAEAASRAKGEFLANMSHEIRTPMNAVIGMTHLALTTDLSAKQRDYLSKIDRAARSLLGILNDILDFSKVEAGMLAMEAVDFDLDLVLEDTAGMLVHKAHEKGLELLVDVADDVPRRLTGDPLRLGQVLVNLAGNAVKFTQAGEVSIRVESLKTAILGQARLAFSVRDSGIGMTPEQQANLFQPFTQADASTSRRFGGTGLGLSISRRLVELMGGSITVTSEAGAGSEFRFELTLPLAQDQGRPLTPEALAGRRVLVVDDSRSAREILATALRRLGLLPGMAASGQEALAMLGKAAQGKPYDLVLLDWKMPEMDGTEVARRIHADTRLKPPPAVVMLTAHNREALAHLPESGLASALLVKPVGQSLLLNTLVDIFGGEAVTPSNQPQAREEAARRALAGIRVLLVEDNEINQQVGAGMLERVGVEVSLAGDGETALALLAVQHFDAVLMDLQMPGMDGFETTRRIRENEPLRSLPVIAMTAHAMQADRERTQAAGMNDHVTKPIEPAALFEALMRHVVRPAARSGPAPASARGPAAPPDVLPERLPGLDVAAALDRMGGDAALYRDLLRQFTTQYAGHPVEIRKAIAQDNRTEARMLIHRLRGVGGNLGAVEVEGCTAALEHALQASATTSELLRLCDALESALARLFGVLPGLEAPAPQAQAPSPERSPEPSPEPERRAGLKALAKALRTRRPRPCGAATQNLQRLSWSKPDAEALADIAVLTDRFKYAEALVRTEVLLQALGEEAAS